MGKTLAAQRRDAAEEVCWTLMLMMGLGGLELDEGWRKYLADHFEPWCDLAVKTGIMKED